MGDVLLAGFVVVVVGLATGRIVRRQAPRLAHVSHYGASALARVLGAAVLALSVARLLDDPDALHIVAAGFLLLLALAVLLSAALMVYGLVIGPARTRDLTSAGPRRKT